MKGGNIVVEGKIGYQSGFMAHRGKHHRAGRCRGESCADALWEGEVWVAGPKSTAYGVDVKVIEPTAEASR